MAIENETPEEEALRLEKEEKEKQPIEITDEAFEAEILKRFGAGSSELMKKADIPPVLSDEDKKKIEDQRKNAVLTTGLAEGWFTKEKYDEHQQDIAKGKIELAKKKFIKSNPELGKEAEAKFNELFLIDEDDEIEENEEMVPNKKKKIAVSVAEKLADEYLKEEYSSIINADSKFEERESALKLGKANLVEIEKQVAAVPKEIEIDLEGLEETKIPGLKNKFSYKPSLEDIKEVTELFKKERSLLGSKNISEEKITENAITYLKAKNIGKLISEGVLSSLKEAQDAYERGEKGILPDRSAGGGNVSEAVQGMRELGFKV